MQPPKGHKKLQITVKACLSAERPDQKTPACLCAAKATIDENEQRPDLYQHELLGEKSLAAEVLSRRKETGQADHAQTD